MELAQLMTEASSEQRCMSCERGGKTLCQEREALLLHQELWWNWSWQGLSLWNQQTDVLPMETRESISKLIVDARNVLG